MLFILPSIVLIAAIVALDFRAQTKDSSSLLIFTHLNQQIKHICFISMKKNVDIVEKILVMCVTNYSIQFYVKEITFFLLAAQLFP